MIPRQIEAIIRTRKNDSKAIILLGPRQSGKTTLFKQLFRDNQGPVLWLNGDDTDTREKLRNPSLPKLTNIVGNYKAIVIDEAQRIENIGLCIKIIIDNLPGVKVYASGSSAFELANKINEPLTGRKWEYYLFPISYSEMANYNSVYEEERQLEHRLVYGYYPEVLMNPGNEIEVLKQLANAYLYKDILTWERILKPDRLEKLTQALAFQVGNEVSYQELGKISGLDGKTIEKYIVLLERAFIVFRLNSFSRNLRNELSKSRKIYFYDNGIRNAIINQFMPLGLRNDTGALWENFLISERFKFTENNRIFCNRYFWRTQQQQEVDYLEERDGTLYVWEFKWGNTSKARLPLTFSKAYPNHIFDVVTRENFENFIFKNLS